MADNKRLLNVQEAASYLGVSAGTIRNWAQNHKLDAIKIGSRGDWRFTQEELNALTKPLKKKLVGKFPHIKDFITSHAQEIEDEATMQHIAYLGTHGVRLPVLKEKKGRYVKLLKMLAKSLEVASLADATGSLRKFGKDFAKSSLEEGLSIEEATDGTTFLKQAIWLKIKKAGLLQNFSLDEYFLLSQTIGTLIDTLSSQIAYTYHNYYKKVEEEQYKLAAIVNSSEDAIICKNLGGFITSWNSSAEKIFGYRAKEAIGKPLVSLIIPKELHFEEESILSNIRQGKPIQHYETVRIRKDGTSIEVSLTVSPVKDNKGNIIGISKIARDITEKKSLERQKDDFLGIASHELKTPVTSLKAYGQVMQSRFAKVGDEKSVVMLAKMDAQIDKLTNLIQDLLDISKIEGGRLQFHDEFFYFDELVSEIVEEIQRTTTKHTIHIEGRTGKTICGDSYRIGQVITNFLTNAIKYSPHTQPILVTLKSTKQQVYLCVQDSGVGIPKEKLTHVFERFYRVPGKTHDTVPGMGIGLYIASEIISRQGGSIWAKSELNKGSTFCFSLPVKPSTNIQQSNTLAEEEIKHE